jgi:HTH-type transcriptional regulator/antitoxin HigA
MNPRVIKSDEQYEATLEAVEELIERDPSPGSDEAEQLELLSVLVEHYEKQNFNLGRPTPVEAIRFRMDQQGLSPRDLVPYLGSRAKVSEVLSGKRPLTLTMIRALHEGLEIPADVLLQAPELEFEGLDYRKFPLTEMRRRGYFGDVAKSTRDMAEALVGPLLRGAQVQDAIPALCRQGSVVRSAKQMDHHALLAWCARVLTLASEVSVPNFNRDAITDDWLQRVARLSWSDQGPRLAREFLAQYGVILIVEPHLPKTHLDGAAMLTADRTPVVGMTVRHDRLDNFWFTLLHELVHVQKHLSENADSFIDDLDFEDSRDPRETEADRGARDALIPPSCRFKQTRAFRQKTPQAIRELASQLQVHPAIIAGRIRHDVRNFRMLGQLVGCKQVRSVFEGVPWPK